MSKIENERERRRGPKDAVYGWTLFKEYTNASNSAATI